MLGPRTFPCPACHEFINESMQSCRFCSAPVDANLASAAVEHQEKINKACNSASLIRNLAGVMWVCFFARLIPFFGLIALVAMILLFVIVPIRLVIWLFRFGGIRTEDVDYKRAKRNIIISFVLWLLMIIVPVALAFLLAGTFALLR